DGFWLAGIVSSLPAISLKPLSRARRTRIDLDHLKGMQMTTTLPSSTFASSWFGESYLNAFPAGQHKTADKGKPGTPPTQPTGAKSKIVPQTQGTEQQGPVHHIVRRTPQPPVAGSHDESPTYQAYAGSSIEHNGLGYHALPNEELKEALTDHCAGQ